MTQQARVPSTMEGTVNNMLRSLVPCIGYSLACSVPFRTHVSSDPSPLVGLRASPTGSYLLVMFKEGPAELWAMPKHAAASGTTVITSLNSSSSSTGVVVPSTGTATSTAAGGGGGEGNTSAIAGGDTAVAAAGSGGTSESAGGGAAAAAGSAAGATGGSGSSSKGSGGSAQMPASTAPFRLRLLDLRFTAVEWVMPDQEQKVLKRHVPEAEEPIVMVRVVEGMSI